MANLSNINNKFIVTDGGNVLIGDTANYSGRLQIKDTQTSSFNDGLAITRNNVAQTGYINMVGGAFNFNSPGLSYKFRNSGTQTLELNSSGNATFEGTGTFNGSNVTVINDSDPNFTVSDTDTNYRGSMRWLSSSNVLEFFTRYAGTFYTNNLVLDRGNVGIGTDSPDNKLDIALTTAAISFDTAIKVSANTDPVDYTANRGAGILFQNADSYVAGIYGIRPTLGGWRGHLLFYTHTSASNNTFGTTFTEKMRITDEGNVGIGTDLPVVPLHIVGTAVDNPSNGNGGYEVMQVFDDTSYATGVGGGIGFGGKFTSSNSTIFSEIRGIKENATDNNYAGALIFSTRANGANITETMRIDSSGNVGINAIPPTTWVNGTEHWDTLQIGKNGVFSAYQNNTEALFGVNTFVNTSGDYEAITASTDGFGIILQPDDINFTFFHTYATPAQRAYPRMTLKSTGELGIGTTSPAQQLDILYPSYIGKDTVQGLLRLTGQSNTENGAGIPSAGVALEFYNKWTGGTAYSMGRISARGEQSFNGGLQFDVSDNTAPGQNNFTTAMSIDAEANVLIGTNGDPTSGGFKFDAGTDSILRIGHATGTGTGSNYTLFYLGTSIIGSISQNGTSAVSFNTSSDYRLKEDLKDFAGLDMVSKIPVYDFKWKTDENRSYGVMAHELEEVLPQAVSGEKDAEEMQGVDYSKIVPLLVKSIQELKAEVDLLKK